MKNKTSTPKKSSTKRSSGKTKRQQRMSTQPDKDAHKSREIEILNLWEKRKVYRFSEKTSELPTYVIREMPTPVHSLSLDTLRRKIYQDIFLKYETMNGHTVAYSPLWETFPFVIEASVIKENNAKTSGNIINFRKQCRQLYSEYLKSQQQKLKRLGIFADWSSSDKTLEARYETKLFSYFDRLRDSKYLRDELRLSQWCPKCVAPLEMGKTVTSVPTEVAFSFVKFPFKDGFEELGKDAYFAVRFPISHLWEIAGTIGIGIYENSNFCLTEYDDQYLIFAERQFEKLSEMTTEDQKVPKQLTELNARQFMECTLSHPLFSLTDLPFFAIPEKIVDTITDISEKNELMDGIIPLNPAHHSLSHTIYNLMPDIRNIINTNSISSTSTTPIFDETGRFTEDADSLCGLYLYNAIQLITDELENRECLMTAKTQKINQLECQHCNGISVLRPYRHWTFSTNSHSIADEITTSPEYWEHYDENIRYDIQNKMSSVADMRISSQRQWGIPLPILRCDNCNHLITDKKILRAVRSSIRRGAEHWFRLSVDELLPTDAFCDNCHSKDFRKESTYIESHFANLLQTLDLSDFKKSTLETAISVAFVPRNAFLKWLGELSVLSVSLQLSRPSRESHPFKHLDLNEIHEAVSGTEIHDNILEEYPADVVRLIAITPDIHQLHLEDGSTEQLETSIEKHCKSYKRLQEALYEVAEEISDFKKSGNEERFALLNLRDTKVFDKLQKQDALAVSRTNQLLKQVEDAYHKRDFYKMWVSLCNFCIDDLHFYLSLCKADSSDSTQFALTSILKVLLQRLAPIIPYLAEDTHTKAFDASQSIFEEKWHEFPQIRGGNDEENEWESLKESKKSET